MIVRKLLVTDGSADREILLVGTLVVGRDPSCQLNALDPLLSRRHAEFVCSSHGVTIRDLKSRNGILVNGNKVPEHALKPGDVIQLGHLHMQYVEESVVKSPEDSARFHATTATGFELPTMTPAARPSAAGRPSGAATAPTATAPTPTEPAAAAAEPPASAAAILSRSSDETGIDRTVVSAARQPAPPIAPPPAAEVDSDGTVAPVARRAAPVPTPAPAPIRGEDTDTDVTRMPAARAATPERAAQRSADDGMDTTMAPTPGRASAAPTPSAPVKTHRDADDPDATRVPGAYAAAAVQDLDTTIAPAFRPHSPAAAKPAPSTEARLVANASLIITEASPSCPAVIGARPETLVGGQLADAIARSVRFVATGDGPSALSLSIARASSGKTITVTFRAGQATENLS
jgi:FHA domain-containing protein